MNNFDGRKRTAMYFGNAGSSVLFEWYCRVKNELELDGYLITHLAYATKLRPFSEIRNFNRVEKRYISDLKENPDKATGLEIYIINEAENTLQIIIY